MSDKLQFVVAHTSTRAKRQTKFVGHKRGGKRDTALSALACQRFEKRRPVAALQKKASLSQERRFLPFTKSQTEKSVPLKSETSRELDLSLAQKRARETKRC